MTTPQRLPAVGYDDGTWGDILRQYLMKEHVNDDLDHPGNGGHQNVTITAGTASKAPLTLTAGANLTTAAAGSVEYDGNYYYLTTSSGIRKTVAAYNDASGAKGDIYYRDAGGNFTPLPIGGTGNVLTVASGVPAWQAPATNGDMTKAVYDPANIAQQVVGTTANRTLANKTLTNPKIGTIYDSNGNIMLDTSSNSGAVNYVAIQNQIAGSYPSFQAAGSDSAVGFNLRPKGNAPIRIYTDSGVTPTLTAAGVDANLDLNLTSKGTGTGIKANGIQVADISSAQTLTNKTLTSPTIAAPTFSGTYSFGGSPNWPIFNQSTTGSAATLTTPRNFQTNLASTSAVSFNGSADNTHGVTGTLPVGNGGTGATTFTTGNVLTGAGTGAVTATKAAPSGAFVGTTDSQVLTNKDLTSGTNVFPAFGGMLKPARVVTTGAETYTISGGAVTQINGTTVDGITVAIGDRVVVAHAPAASGAGTPWTTTTQPANGVYRVTANTTNLTLTRDSDMTTGTGSPVGQSIYIERGANYGQMTWTIRTPDDNSAFTWNTTGILWNGQVGAVLLYGTNVTATQSITMNGVGVADVSSAQTLTNKTLTDPKISAGIKDANGNYIFGLNSQASANNYISAKNAPNGSTPSLFSYGNSDTNVSLNLTTQGSGTVQANGVPVLTGATAAVFAPVRVADRGTETYTISSGTVTQIAGTTIDTVSVSVGDRVLIQGAPASTGVGGGYGTNNPANGIYTVTGNTTNISLLRATDLSGTNNPAGRMVVATDGSWNQGIGFKVFAPSNPASAFSYGTTSMQWDVTIKRFPVDLTNSQTLSNKTFDNTNTITVKDGTGLTIQNASDATRQVRWDVSNVPGSTTVSLATPGISTTLVGRSTVDTLSNKTLTNPTVNNYTEGMVTVGTVTNASTLDLTNGTLQTATLTASTACTFTMPTATAGKSFVLMLKQAATTGNGSATFTGVKWGASNAPTITATAGKMDILSFFSDGSSWYGSFSQGYTP